MGIVNIAIKSGKYEKCQIDLSKYEIVSSSMSASWYKRKKELKLTFDIAPMSRLEIEKMREKHRQKIKTMKKKTTKTSEIVKDDEKSFLIKEVSTKCIVKKEEKKREVVPLCHHKLRMKEVLITNKGKNEGKSFWICAKPQSEKCTAFKWNEQEKIIKHEFEIVQREKFDKVVLLIRIADIIQTSVDVKFAQNGQIVIAFETEKVKYKKELRLDDGCAIDVDKSRFDVNCRNLLIMVYKQKKGNAIDDLLNDSALLDIN